MGCPKVTGSSEGSQSEFFFGEQKWPTVSMHVGGFPPPSCCGFFRFSPIQTRRIPIYLFLTQLIQKNSCLFNPNWVWLFPPHIRATDYRVMITVEAVCEVQPLASGKGESPPIFSHPAFPVQPPQLRAQASPPFGRAAGVFTRIDQAQRWHWKQEVGGTGPMWKLEKLLMKDETQFPAQGFPGIFLQSSFCTRLSICCLIYL